MKFQYAGVQAKFVNLDRPLINFRSIPFYARVKLRKLFFPPNPGIQIQLLNDIIHKFYGCNIIIQGFSIH